MELLGKYNSTITTYLYSSLLKMFTSKITNNGDNGGVLNISDANILELVKQATNLSNVPIPSFNSRSNEEQINYPIDLLNAIYTAISNEFSNFTGTTEALLNRLTNEANLLDKLIYQAKLEYWKSTLPTVLNANTYSQDFNQGLGLLSSDIGFVDPTGGGSYSQNTNVGKILDVSLGYREGLLPSNTEAIVNCSNINWSTNSLGVIETIEGTNIARINILEKHPQVYYSPTANYVVTLPQGGSIAGIFSISGDTSMGPISTYIRTGFYPRENQISLTPYNSLNNNVFTTGWTVSGWTITSGVAQSVSGSLTSPTLKDNSGNTFLANSGQVIYVSANVFGTTGAAPLIVNLLGYDASGTLQYTQKLSSPTANSSSYTWFFTTTLPDNTVVTNLKLQFVATDANWSISNPAVYVPMLMSNYQLDVNKTSVFILNNLGRVGTVYNSFDQYQVNDNYITFLGLPFGSPLNIRFTEFYPYYQCSVNNSTWSPIVMLDGNRPYQDEVAITHLIRPIPDTGGGFLFPITDETGKETGLYIKMIGNPIYSYLFQVSVTANPNWGDIATLELDLATTGYLTGLVVDPFVEFPMLLTQVELEGFSPTTRSTVWSGSFELDTQTTICFNKQLVRKAYLTFRQPAYTSIDSQIMDVSFIRNKSLQQLESLLPLVSDKPNPISFHGTSGFEYDLGLQNILGVDTTYNATSVTVSGPFLVEGCPELLTYYSNTTGTLGQYLCYIAYDVNGNVVDSNTSGVSLTNGESVVMPFSGMTDRSTIVSTNIYIKYVLRSSTASVARFSLQVNTR